MRFRTTVIDPPWLYPEGTPAFGSSTEERKALPYEQMSLESIVALPMYSIMDPESYLFLWTTSHYLPDAFSCLTAWRCAYRQTLTWRKPPRGLGPGGVWATTTEFILVAQRIGPNSNGRKRMTTGVRFDRSDFDWPRREHSEKPHEFYSMLEQTHLEPRVDIFARKRRVGWTSVGNELDGLDIHDALKVLSTPTHKLPTVNSPFLSRLRAA